MAVDALVKRSKLTVLLINEKLQEYVFNVSQTNSPFTTIDGVVEMYPNYTWNIKSIKLLEWARKARIDLLEELAPTMKTNPLKLARKPKPPYSEKCAFVLIFPTNFQR